MSTTNLNDKTLEIGILANVIPRQNLKCIYSLYVHYFPDQPDSSIFLFIFNKNKLKTILSFKVINSKGEKN